PVRRDVAEATAIPPRGEVRDDLEALSGLLEGALESTVVAGRHEELVRETPLAQHGRQRGEEAMNRRRRQIGAEKLVELVVERPGALHDGDVLRDPREGHRAAANRILEVLGEAYRQLRHVGSENGDDPSLEHRL